MAQIQGKSFTYIRRQGKLIPAPSFRSNGDPRIFPIDVFEIQGNDFAGPETESGQQKQNRVIAFSDRSFSIAAIQHSLNAAGGEILG
jgi:hypothetical protein